MAGAFSLLEPVARGAAGAADRMRLCRAITKEHSKTFYFASLFMDAPKREAIWAVYAFCRIADDIADSPAPATERLDAIDGWRSELLAACSNGGTHPVALAFADAARDFAIPLEPALDLLAGARRDVTVRRYETYAELCEYAYLVASTVGLLTAPILGYAPGALAYGIVLGRAMQLTNILRDVGEDARMGRIYLPAEDLRRFGYSERKLNEGVIDAAFIELMQFQIARVRAMYERAEPGIALLDSRSRYTVRLALELYRGILAEIERNRYDVFSRRARLGTRAKLIAALATSLAR